MRQEPEGFSNYWDVWKQIKRRNDGRGDARKAFEKHVKAGADPQDIIDGARWYARNIPTGYEYVPLSATWMNREVWADDAEKEREYQKRLQEREERSENVVQMTGPTGKTDFLRKWEQQKKASA